MAERASQKQSIEGQLAQRQQMLAGIQSEIKQLQAEEARRQAQLQRGGRGTAGRAAARRLDGSRGGNASSRPAASPPRSTRRPSDSLIPAAPPSQYGGVVGHRDAGARQAVRLGRGGPERLRLLRARHVRLRPGRRLVAPQRRGQYGYGSPVAYDDLQPGDLVFFSGLGHVGIYIGGGQFIHAPHTGDVVKISSLSTHGGYVGARRL